MGRKVDEGKVKAVLQVIEQQDGNVRMNDVAKAAGLSAERVSSLLARVDDVTGILLQEDDRGFLGIFKRR